MIVRYSAAMPVRQTLPLIWLLSDARNDAALEASLARLPARSGFVFRHYHLEPDCRRTRFEELAKVAWGCGHCVIVSGLHHGWGADGVYGPVASVAQAPGGLRLGTAHGGDDLQAANHARLDGVFLSPVFATRSHPGAAALGMRGFQVLAQQALVPVIALGGMTAARAHELDWPRWGAIDGLV